MLVDEFEIQVVQVGRLNIVLHSEFGVLIINKTKAWKEICRWNLSSKIMIDATADNHGGLKKIFSVHLILNWVFHRKMQNNYCMRKWLC